ncbi:MAG: hypothetical protein WBM63_00235 [Sedimenticolaceae bacterium]
MPEAVLRAFSASLLCLLSGICVAALEFGFAVDDIEAEGWGAQGISIALSSDSAGVFASVIQVARLDLPDGRGSIQGLKLDCAQIVQSDAAWQCAKGTLSAQDSPIETQDTTWQGSLKPGGDWQIAIERLSLGRGSIALELSAQSGNWAAEVRAHQLPVGRLAELSRAIELPPWGIKGQLSGRLLAEGSSAGLSSLAADLVTDQIAYASADGLNAAENLVLKTELKARLLETGWSFQAGLAWPRGALYADPVFLDAGEAALTATASGIWQADPGLLRFDSWSIGLADTVGLSGTGRLQGPDMAVTDLTIVARSDRAGRLYKALLQPYLTGTAADDMDVTGQIGLVLHLDPGGIEQAGLDMSGLVLEDRQGRFSVGRTDGSVAWDRSKTVPESRLTVQGASIYRIPAGDFSIRAHFAGDRVYLVEPVVVPVSGGQVALDSFELRGALVAGEKPRWEANASVLGVSLEQLTSSLDWPPFGGTLEGRLRDMRYADQVFSIGGGLQAKAFEGDILVTNLNIQDPLGTVPILHADAEFRGLSLLALTRTFSFGRIEGRLDGRIDDIQLVGWQPDRFNMHLYSPPDDDSRHRISQRAVENLTEIGNGLSAGLSTTFLRVFDEFRYDNIDLKIVLQGNVAELDGLARSDGGYYLVKGAGLPRIDVIGRNRSVAWKDLVERLQQIQVEGARIE